MNYLKGDRRDRPTNIRIPKDKPLVQFILYPIHLTPNNAKQRFTINQYLDPVLLYRFIKFASFIHVFQMVCETGTSSVFYSDSYESGLGQGEEIAKLRRCSWCERYRCLSGPELGGTFGLLG